MYIFDKKYDLVMYYFDWTCFELCKCQKKLGIFLEMVSRTAYLNLTDFISTGGLCK